MGLRGLNHMTKQQQILTLKIADQLIKKNRRHLWFKQYTIMLFKDNTMVIVTSHSTQIFNWEWLSKMIMTYLNRRTFITTRLYNIHYNGMSYKTIRGDLRRPEEMQPITSHKRYSVALGLE
jgi:hypothetical protein